jgi:hypothetical protein
MADDGAKMVRIYGPICEQEMVWDNIVQAAAENNLLVLKFIIIINTFNLYYSSGVLGIVWFGYDDQEIKTWRQRESSLLANLKKPLSKYVIHSVSFGSEPLFSWSISDIYVAELQKLKGELQTLGVPLTVSEVDSSFFRQFLSLNYDELDEIRI